MAALGQGMLFINTRGGGGGPGMGAILTIPSVVGSIIGGFVYVNDPMLPWLLLGASLVFNAAVIAALTTPPEGPQ